MERSSIDAATEITVAWLNSLGTEGLKVVMGFSAEDHGRIVSDFYKTVFQAVIKPDK